MILLVLVVMLAYFVGMPTLLWARSLEASRRNWPGRSAGHQTIVQGTFRDAEIPRMSPAAAPPVVQTAALGSWVLGAMFLPGLVGGFIGLAFFGVGLFAAPGLVLAARLFLLAGPLMRGEATAAVRARSAATHARVLNYVITLLCVGVFVASFVSPFGNGRQDDALRGLAVITQIYALISLGHAWVLERAARAIDSLHTSSADVRIDLAGIAAPVPDAVVDADGQTVAAGAARRANVRAVTSATSHRGASASTSATSRVDGD